jgi:hypothetical protein
MESFVGCKIIKNKAKNTIYIHQPKLLNNLKEQIGALVESLKDFETPAPPRVKTFCRQVALETCKIINVV